MTNETEQQPIQPAENGFEFNMTFMDGCGLSPYSVLEAAWVLPAIIVGIRTKVWAGVYSKKVVPPPILSLWIDLQLITTNIASDKDEVEAILTEAGNNIVKMADLFEYEFSMMQQQLDENFITDPEKYRKLRKALAMYSDQYLPPITEWLDEQAGTHILDFGGGEGYYLEKLLKSGLNREGVLYDRAPNYGLEGMEGIGDRCEVWKSDFRDGSDTFFTAYAGTFDTIILSEVLHCVAHEEYPKLLHQLAGMLTPKGKLLIIEQRPSFRMDWRLKAMTDGGESLDLREVINRMQIIPDLDLTPDATIVVATHYAITYIKGE